MNPVKINTAVKLLSKELHCKEVVGS